MNDFDKFNDEVLKQKILNTYKVIKKGFIYRVINKHNEEVYLTFFKSDATEKADMLNDAYFEGMFTVAYSNLLKMCSNQQRSK